MSRNTRPCGVRLRNIFQNQRIRTNTRMISNVDATQNFRINHELNMIADNGTLIMRLSNDNSARQ